MNRMVLVAMDGYVSIDGGKYSKWSVLEMLSKEQT